MAVPPHITTSNLTGIYTLNRALSDSSQQTLKMQNVSWLVRQAVQYSNIETTLKQYSTIPTTASSSTTEGTSSVGDSNGDAGVPQQQHHLDQYQISTGGIRSFEDRVMDWQWTVKPNKIWGDVRGRSRYTPLSSISEDWLREGWDETCTSTTVVEGFVEGVKDGWTSHQVWGFAVVEGQRRHVRRIVARREGWSEERVRMVYDWKGETEQGGAKPEGF